MENTRIGRDEATGCQGEPPALLASRWSIAARAMAKLSVARRLEEVVGILRDTARAAVGADGIAIVLREGDMCHYYAEDAMDRLWTGSRSLQDAGVPGWTMLNRKSAAIPDIALDGRVLHEAYQGTFVKSMLMVPIGASEPVAALGAYWSDTGHPDADETAILEALAHAAATALANGRLVEEMAELNRNLEARIEQRTRDLEAAHRSLQQAQKLELMGQLTGTVAHDFNNLLSPIMTSLELILQSDASGEAVPGHAHVAMEAVEHARALVERLLAFARRQPLASAPVDIRALLKGMEALLSSTVGGRIDLRILVPPGLPNILADRHQLEIAILNLAVNARDAMPNGGVLTIAANASAAPQIVEGKEESFIRVTVSDEGSGMDDATRARVFEPFYTTKPAGSGTGLGLPMVHGVVNQLGGAMDIQSELGRGTQVSLWLPITRQALTPKLRVQLEEPRLKADGTAMIVDDHQLVRRGTAAILRKAGYKVVEVDSARACLARLGEGMCPDIVITDHVMPGMTGLDLARSLAQSHPHIPIILVSGYDDLGSDSTDIVRMKKPFRQHELQAAIALAHQRAEARGQMPLRPMVRRANG